MECPKLPACIFFNDLMEDMPAVTEVLKKQFCRGSYTDCARHRVSTKLGPAAVPKDLFPSDQTRADRLLEGGA
ncbi:MAG TPA: hypothetical protein VMX54_00475 [Vicinamibacteria bacterium]|nr:hypothetical protein [Vicinamibacteria bacterium]